MIGRKIKTKKALSTQYLRPFLWYRPVDLSLDKAISLTIIQFALSMSFEAKGKDNKGSFFKFLFHLFLKMYALFYKIKTKLLGGKKMFTWIAILNCHSFKMFTFYFQTILPWTCSKWFITNCFPQDSRPHWAYCPKSLFNSISDIYWAILYLS